MKRFVVVAISIVFALLFADSVKAEGWVYSESRSGIDNERSQDLMCLSNNSLNLAFPYKGDNQGVIIVKRVGDKITAGFTIEKGQIEKVHQPWVKVKFDDKKTELYYVRVTDSIAFINDSNQFIDEIKDAKTVKIEFDVFMNGLQLLDFNVTGFDLSKLL